MPLVIWGEVTYGERTFHTMIEARWVVVKSLLAAIFKHYFISAIGLSIFYSLLSLHVEYTYNSHTIF
ncbi:unnamed protein product, partial [Mesorhabditis spiculigera]